MIERLHLSKKTHLASLLEFITKSFDFDFYFTHDNSRIYIQDAKSLRNFLRQSHYIFLHPEKGGEYNGIVMLWKSSGGGKERYYLKIKAENAEVAKNLLTVLLWNVGFDVYAKIRKDNPILPALRNKGFRFLGGRGLQTLFVKKHKTEALPNV